jgi:aspartyl-tRNA(Asn)/glutamyl-tRNA(Gln) amidotransferase subunit C
MKIDAAEVRRIAALAHLELTDPEVERMRLELTAILDYVEQIPPLEEHRGEIAGDVATPLRDDAAGESLASGAVARNAPSFDHGCFVVPLVIGE